MASKRKKDELNARRQKQRLKKLARSGLLANGVEMPRGAIAADLSQQSGSSAFSRRNFYTDIEFTCVDCGAEEVWPARDQKWFFEVVKGNIYSMPKRCLTCRKKARQMKAEQRLQMEAADNARH
ncbi:MAG TPA: zinc-ribbon domain containing protein [Lacipirellulaceae bacterium]|jgi:hypothetical protein|nr:zinc-ribbon domain containing protein [Lacipirellulaceae bacterium]